MGSSRRMFRCIDCGVDTGKIGEYYMLRDDVWLSVVDSRKGMLCIRHVEARLGRRLNAADFVDAPINRIGNGWNHQNSQLAARLTAVA